ncbi:flagellar type III secretion system pore protein FliP [Caulobacter radicis]|uniref:Flagellar biosynthetic protein FliP n=1 Tax=Caulobacter radicis TaxID=2172650 RepID=A0A2T9JGM5_9CAUL|nr:flagellar type III secretion system pore protein FliP [Caulobacter radicis]PVM82837.1 flagellar biosynthetic protein FliP [Caulobacter radicis]
MNRLAFLPWILTLVLTLTASLAIPAGAAWAQSSSAPAAAVATPRAKTAGQAVQLDKARTSEVLRTALLLTVAALIPAIVICMTPFVRIVVVLSMIRHAFGMPETPPNQVLVSLALFLTAFTMMPTLTTVNDVAFKPFMDGSISVQQAMDRGAEPMRQFMLRQVHDQDIAAVYRMAKKPLPERAADVGLMELTSAFMLNELRVAFKIGFVILLPFLLIDLVVSSILLALGMLMVPPSTLSLPIKVLMFVLIDGWSLVLENVVGSFR